MALNNNFCMVSFNTSGFGNMTIASTPNPTTVLWQYLTGSLCFFGSLANIIVLIVVVNSRQLRKGAGIFIVHLLLCHVILCVSVYPWIVYRIANTQSRLNDADYYGENCSTCRYQHILMVLFNNLINWSDAMLALKSSSGHILSLAFSRFQ